MITSVKQWSPEAKGIVLFWSLMLSSILATVLCAATEWLALILWPAGLAGFAFLATAKQKYILAAVAFCIPFSVDTDIGGGVHVDLPTEVMLVFGLVCAVLLWAKRGFKVDKIVFKNNIHLFLLVHLIWITLTVLFSGNTLISAKFLAAKAWFVVPFLYLPLLLRLGDKEIQVIIDFLLVGTLIAAAYYFFSHAQAGLTFEARTNAGQPIWRNHVNYACMLVLCLPLIWYRAMTSKKKTIYTGLVVAFLVLIYFSYARVAYLSMISYMVGAVIIKWRLSRVMITASVVLITVSTGVLVKNNRYLDLSQEYTKAVTQERFDRLVTSTYKREDISSMERIYRWVAGAWMIRDRPVFGHGPGNFYDSYKPYAVSSFATYVSDNPDKSGIHNYFLMTATEQGVPGLLILLGLFISALLQGQHLLGKLKQREDRMLIWTALMLVFGVLAINLINDMLEVVKVGAFFFFALFLLIRPQVKPE